MWLGGLGTRTECSTFVTIPAIASKDFVGVTLILDTNDLLICYRESMNLHID